MQAVTLTKEEFCLFNINSKMTLLDMHGKMITFKVINDSIVISVYSIYEYYIQVVQRLPKLELVEIKPVQNKEGLFRYLGLRLNDS